MVLIYNGDWESILGAALVPYVCSWIPRARKTTLFFFPVFCVVGGGGMTFSLNMVISLTSKPIKTARSRTKLSPVS